jgi:hypothetical protein
VLIVLGTPGIVQRLSIEPKGSDHLLLQTFVQIVNMLLVIRGNQPLINNADYRGTKLLGD